MSKFKLLSRCIFWFFCHTFNMKKKITVRDAWQNYTYFLTEPIGKNFDPGFKPELTPQEMLEVGVFGGKYFHDKPKEFPKSWFVKAKLSPDGVNNPELNFFNIKASSSLAYWQKKGWIYKDDPRGWFQWYARYYMGRRLPEEDQRQIKRWKSFKRHFSAVQKNCFKKDLSCRPKQRQALLHWAYDSRKI